MIKIRKLCTPLFLSIAFFFFAFCTNPPPAPHGSNSGSDYHYTEPVETDDGWVTGTLSSVGMDENLFKNLVLKIQNGTYTEIHSIIVVRNNKLVFEKYWPGHDFAPFATNYLGASIRFDRDTRHDTHSATKSIISALIGIAIDYGQIQSQGDVIFKYLPAKYEQWNNQGRERITVEHCLMMASGLHWNEWEVPVTAAENDLMVFMRSSDPVGYLLSKPVTTEPGTRFYYNGGTVNLLGVMLAFASDQSVQTFSSRYLFGPLGISNYNWQVIQPSGLTFCSGDIYITPRDMAKIGQLYLNEGEWNGRRIFSKQWVEQSTSHHINPAVTWADGYGYLWWLRNFQVNGKTYSSFKAIGWGGQEIFVFKDLNIVVVFTGANYTSNPPCDGIMRQYILPSIED